ncbi:unnamed protein product [Blepharisma stoltei]|uniref:Uncharacterized protein n=1 Tax=Blepharisma stoltei TaxID=1481888 RepID=A0AAU9J3X8_9CILI|nr:unnamed protein product [Blepharisma stoltei]
MSSLFPNKATNISMSRKYTNYNRIVYREQQTLDKVLNFLNISNQSLEFKPKIRPLRSKSHKKEEKPYPHPQFVIHNKCNPRYRVKSFDFEPIKPAKIAVPRSLIPKKDPNKSSYKVFKMPLEVDLFEKKQLEHVSSFKNFSVFSTMKRPESNAGIRTAFRNRSPITVLGARETRTKSSNEVSRPALTVDREIQLSKNNSDNESASYLQGSMMIDYDFDKEIFEDTENKIENTLKTLLRTND